MLLSELPEDIINLFREFLSFKDCEILDTAINQIYNVPKWRVEEWFKYHFRSSWDKRTLLASHPSIHLVPQNTLQNYIFNVIRPTIYYDSKRECSVKSYEYDWKKHNHEKEMIDFVLEFINKGLVNPNMPFLEEHSFEPKDARNCCLFRCWSYEIKLQKQLPLKVAAKYSWSLVSKLLEYEYVDPSYDDNDLLVRAIHLNKKDVVLQIFQRLYNDPAVYKTVTIKLWKKTKSFNPAEQIILNGWLDIYKILETKSNFELFPPAKFVSLLVKLSAKPLTEETQELAEYLIQKHNTIINYAIPTLVKEKRWDYVRLYCKHCTPGVKLRLEKGELPQDIDEAIIAIST
ncbi:hypothetical protein HK103_003620 [Boothiomyces macroporosus]|uniref:Uncharacterized protein n=1 Tax=Boothiomyces macroporosus TaxID=261099 RepID=A0AAD5Y3Z5_9FUNG|nr:hypothetical protein HK103_003620 [Boothiomyces macroporosus]